MYRFCRSAALCGLCGLFALALGTWFAGRGPTVRAEETGPSPDPPLTRAITAYRSHCANCHGTDGKGGRARSDTPEIPDFTAATWHRRRGNPHLLSAILDGKGNNMPAFADKLNKDQAKELVAYVRAFAPDAQATPARPAESTDDFERQFRQLQQQLAELRKQYEAVAPPVPKKP